MKPITEIYKKNVAAKSEHIYFQSKNSSTFEVLFLKTYSPKITCLDDFDILKYHSRFVPQNHFTIDVIQIYQNIKISGYFGIFPPRHNPCQVLAIVPEIYRAFLRSLKMNTDFLRTGHSHFQLQLSYPMWLNSL